MPTVPDRITIDGSSLPDRFVSRDVAAEFLGLSSRTLATWASAGIGPAFRKLSTGRSGCVRYSLNELQTYMADPAAYRPRPVVRFNRPASVKRGGQPNVSIARARRKRHGSANKSG
jgi:hypothetical protein